MSSKMNKRMKSSRYCDGIYDSSQRRRTKDLKHTLRLTLEEMYTGTERYIQVQREIVCANCKLDESTSTKDTCEECNGSGCQYVTRRTIDNRAVEMKRTCTLCWGVGELATVGQRCMLCGGRKVVPDDLDLVVKVGRGSRNGQTIVYENQGTQEPNSRSGDVIVTLESLPHHTFKRRDDDLMMTVHLDLVESLCGFEKLVTTLDNRQLCIKSPKGKVINTDDMKYVVGEGMPNFSNSQKRGNLHIRFEVNLQKVPAKFIRKVKTCLPLPDEIDVPFDAIECNMRNMTLNIERDEKHNHSGHSTVENDYNLENGQYESGMHENASTEHYEQEQFHYGNNEQASGFEANGYGASGYEASGYDQQYYHKQRYSHHK